MSLYTSTIDVNVIRALDPRTRIYDKRKIEDVSQFKGLYVITDKGLDHALINDLNIQKEVGIHDSYPVLISGELCRGTDVTTNPTAIGYIINPPIILVDRIYKFDKRALYNHGTPLKEREGIIDLTNFFFGGLIKL